MLFIHVFAHKATFADKVERFPTKSAERWENKRGNFCVCAYVERLSQLRTHNTVRTLAADELSQVK